MVTIDTETLRAAIKQSGMSQAKVAVMANSSLQTLIKILNNNQKLRLDTINDVAEYLGYDTLVFFKRKSNEETKTWQNTEESN